MKPRFTASKAVKEAMKSRKYATHCDEAVLKALAGSPAKPVKKAAKKKAKR